MPKHPLFFRFGASVETETTPTVTLELTTHRLTAHDVQKRRAYPRSGPEMIQGCSKLRMGFYSFVRCSKSISSAWAFLLGQVSGTALGHPLLPVISLASFPSALTAYSTQPSASSSTTMQCLILMFMCVFSSVPLTSDSYYSFFSLPIPPLLATPNTPLDNVLLVRF